MSAQILPFRQRARGPEVLSSNSSPNHSAPFVWDMGKIQIAMMRDELVAGFLECRDVHLRRMSRADRMIVQSISHFILYGGLAEDRRSVEHNLQVVRRLISRYRRPQSTFHRIGWLIHEWLWEVSKI